MTDIVATMIDCVTKSAPLVLVITTCDVHQNVAGAGNTTLLV